jgi:hypothetical protein
VYSLKKIAETYTGFHNSKGISNGATQTNCADKKRASTTKRKMIAAYVLTEVQICSKDASVRTCQSVHYGLLSRSCSHKKNIYFLSSP